MTYRRSRGSSCSKLSQYIVNVVRLNVHCLTTENKTRKLLRLHAAARTCRATRGVIAMTGCCSHALTTSRKLLCSQCSGGWHRDMYETPRRACVCVCVILMTNAYASLCSCTDGEWSSQQYFTSHWASWPVIIIISSSSSSSSSSVDTWRHLSHSAGSVFANSS